MAVLCVNANAAIDKTVIVSAFRLNAIHRPEQILALPGGKGANVARALKCLGETLVVTGWVGGLAGQFIEQGLQAEGIETLFVQAPFESRTCLTILDPLNHTTTEIYERGDVIPDALVREFQVQFRSVISRFTAITLSGSLPPGVPFDFYAGLIEIAREARVPALLDSSGRALHLGLEARPAVVKPNQAECEEWLGRKLVTLEECASAAQQMARTYETLAVISLGARGLVAANGKELIRAVPPQIDSISAVGSGDCALAGIAFGLTHGFSLQEMLRYGAAAGAANALSLGAGYFSRADVDGLIGRIALS